MRCVRRDRDPREADRISGVAKLKSLARKETADGDGRCVRVDEIQEPLVGRAEQHHCCHAIGDRGRHRPGNPSGKVNPSGTASKVV